MRKLTPWLAIALLAGCSSSPSSGDPSDDVVEDVALDSAADATEPDVSPDTTEPDVEPDVPDVGEDTSEPDVAPDVPEDTEEDAPDVDAAVEDTTPDVEVDAADVVEDTAEPLAPIGPIDPNALETVRFILIGDTGEGNEKQYRVSASAGAFCDERGGCHAVVMLGDNIYDEGPSSPDDPLLTDYIDLPYANLRYGPPPAEGEDDERPRMPLLMSLGNHDLGGAGLEARLAQHYIDYARDKDWLYFPTRYWEARIGIVHLAALDTNPLAYLGTEVADQREIVQEATSSVAQYSLIFGHHPYRSEGQHGNAGAYEGVPGDLVFLGGRFRDFVNDYICNQADFYISGHDHNRQWIDEDDMLGGLLEFETDPCNTEFAVSGAGAKSSDFEGRGNDLSFGREDEGFLYMEFRPDGVTAVFASIDGDVQWTEEF